MMRAWISLLALCAGLSGVLGVANCGQDRFTRNATVLFSIYGTHNSSLVRAGAVGTLAGVAFDGFGFPQRPRRLVFTENTGTANRVMALREDGSVSWVAGPEGCVSSCTGNGNMNATLAVGSTIKLGSISTVTVNNVTGDIAFADTGNRYIKRVRYTDGFLWTAAGKATTVGANGDGGPAWDAILTAPHGIAYDTTQWARAATRGDYLLMLGQSSTSSPFTATNNMILRSFVVSPSTGWSGNIDREAGLLNSVGFDDGAAKTAASFRGIHGVGISKKDGTVYMVDRANNAVRGLTRAGQVFTVAGNGVAGYGGDGEVGSRNTMTFKTPTDLAVDDDTDAIFVADNGQSLIRMIDGTTRVVTTIAGQRDVAPALSPSPNFVDGGDPLQSPARAQKLWYDASRKLLIFSDVGAKAIRGITCARRTPAGKFYNITANSFDDCPAGTYCPEELGAMGGWGAFAVSPLPCPAGKTCPAGSSSLEAPSSSATPSVSPSVEPSPTPSASFGVSPSPSESQMASPSVSPSESASPSASASVMASVTPTPSTSSTPVIVSPFLGCAENDTLLFNLYGPSSDSIVRGDSAADAQFTGLAMDFQKQRLVFAEWAATSKYSYVKAIGEDGNVSALVGANKYTHGGDGLPATDATVSMTNLEGLCVDQVTGDIFFLDRGAHRLKKLAGGERTGIVSTVAGDGGSSMTTAAAIGEGGPPTSADLPNPFGVLCETNNVTGRMARILVAQGGGAHVIRLVDFANNRISTIAGTAVTSGFQQGPFATARFNEPRAIYPYYTSPDYGVAGSSRGYVVADYSSHSIRWLNTADQTVYVLAGVNLPGSSGDGGPASAARLRNPNDIVSDVITGNLIIADAGNHRIRMVDWRGTITTVAGSGTASSPSNVVSGQGRTALTTPVTPAKLFFDAARRLLLFTDTGMRGIRGLTCKRDPSSIPAGQRFDLLSNALRPCPKGFLCPAGSGIITLFNGSLVTPLVPCLGNGTYCPAGSAVASVCPAGKYCPGPVYGDAFTCPEGFYCPEGTEAPISCPVGTECAPGSAIPLVPSPSATPSSSASVSATCDPEKIALMSPTPSSSPSRSVEATPSVSSTVTISTTASPKPRAPFLGCGVSGSSPSIDYGNLYVFTLYGNSNSTGAFVNAAAVKSLGGIALDDGRNSTGHFVRSPRLYFAEYQTSNAEAKFSYIRAIDANGQLTGVSGGTSGSGYFGNGILATDPAVKHSNIVDMDIDPDSGDLYLVERDVNRVRRVARSTGFIHLVAGNGNPAPGAEGSLATAVGATYPMGLLFHRGGFDNALGKRRTSLFFAGDTQYHAVRQVNLDVGTMATYAGRIDGNSYLDGASSVAMFKAPNGLAAYRHPTTNAADEGSSFTLYVADSGNNALRAVLPDGQVTTVAGDGKQGGDSGDGGQSTSALLKGPTDVEVDQARNMIIIAENDNRILRVIDANGIITKAAGAGPVAEVTAASLRNGNGSAVLFSPMKPLRISLGAEGSVVFFTDDGSKTVRGIACLRSPQASSVNRNDPSENLRSNPAGYMFDVAAEAVVPCLQGYYCPEGNNAAIVLGYFIIAPPACPANGVCDTGSAFPSFPSTTPSPSPSRSLSPSPSTSRSVSPSASPSSSSSRSSTPSRSPVSPSRTPTASRTYTRSVSISFSPSASMSFGASLSPTSSETPTGTITRTSTHSRGASASITGSRSLTPTRTITRTASGSPSTGVSATSTRSANRSPSSTRTGSSMPEPAPLFDSASFTPTPSATYLPPPPAIVETVITVPGLSVEAAQQPSVVQIILDFFACAAAAAAKRSREAEGSTLSPLVLVNVSIPVMDAAGSGAIVGYTYNITSSEMCGAATADSSASGGSARVLRRQQRSLQQGSGISFAALFQINAPTPANGDSGAGTRTSAALALFDSLSYLAGGDGSAGGNQAMADAFAIAVNNLMNDPFIQLDGLSDLSLLEAGFFVASLLRPVIPPAPVRPGASPASTPGALAAVQPSSGGESSSPIGAIVGGVVGGLIAVAVLFIVGMYVTTGRLPWTSTITVKDASGLAPPPGAVSGARVSVTGSPAAGAADGAGRPSVFVANPALYPLPQLQKGRSQISPGQGKNREASIASLREYRSRHLLPSSPRIAAPPVAVGLPVAVAGRGSAGAITVAAALSPPPAPAAKGTIPIPSGATSIEHMQSLRSMYAGPDFTSGASGRSLQQQQQQQE